MTRNANEAPYVCLSFLSSIIYQPYLLGHMASLCGDTAQKNLTKVGFQRIFDFILLDSLFNEKYVTSVDNNQPPTVACTQEKGM